ncbi:MAG: DNA-binding protein [Arachnia sp.]
MPKTSIATPNQTRLLPRYATLPEAIVYCRSSRRSLERRIAEGKLTRFQNGFRVLVDLNEIDAMLRGARH